MKLFRKLFGGLEISWLMLIIYSLITGAVVGLLNCVPFLADTSLVMPAVNYEYWIVAALFVIMNCKKPLEAVEKTFVFFLISQPLIYLVEVPFKAAGWGLFSYYPHWIIPTLLTIPGAWIAYQVKRDNVLSAVILSLASGFLFFTGISTAINLPSRFPKGIITIIFCIAFGIIFIQILLNKKQTKLIGYICSIIIAAAFTLFSIFSQGNHSAATFLDESHQWEIVESDIDAEINGNYLTVNSKSNGTYHITIQNEEGETEKMEVTFDGNTISFEEIN